MTRSAATMNKLKLITMLILVLLLCIVVLQNTDPVRMNFLWLSWQLSAAVLLFLTATLGFAIGVITAIVIMQKKKR